MADRKMITRIDDIDEIKPVYEEYMAHMSRYFDIEDRESWRNDAMQYLQLYSSDNDRIAYVLNGSGKMAGFALMNQYLRFNNDGFAVAEFYIRKGYGGNGFGRLLAEYAFSRFSGNWEVAVASKNEAARIFWQKAVDSYTGGQFTTVMDASYDGIGYLFKPP